MALYFAEDTENPVSQSGPIQEEKTDFPKSVFLRGVCEMSNRHVQEPWKEIEAMIDKGDAQRLSSYLDALTPWEIARAVSRLDDDNQSGLLTLLEPEDAADLIEELSDTQGADLIEDLPARQAAAIVAEMDSDDRVDVLGELHKGDAEAILEQMDPDEAADTRKLLNYDPDTAGGIMVTEFVTYPQHLRVVDVLNDLREHAEEYSDYGVQYAYVVSERDVLIGVVRLRDLVLSPNDAALTSVMIANPLSVLVDASLDELEQFESWLDEDPRGVLNIMDGWARFVREQK